MNEKVKMEIMSQADQDQAIAEGSKWLEDQIADLKTVDWTMHFMCLINHGDSKDMLKLDKNEMDILQRIAAIGLFEIYKSYWQRFSGKEWGEQE